MSKASQKVAVQPVWTVLFYWVGVIASLLCIGLSFARNASLVSNFDAANFPLSWAAGAIAIIAFLAAEYCHPPAPAKVRAEELVEASSWETEFADI